jgi:endonuclease III
MPQTISTQTAERVYSLVARAAQQPDLKAAVEANHDDNRWWPVSVGDWRMRMTIAGWSSRISYSMITTYADVVSRADALGWDALTALDDATLAWLIRPLGLTASRTGYLRSLAGLIAMSGHDLPRIHPEQLIAVIASQVHGAGYKVAQCAALYARGYHSGIIPVDSGMVTKLAPFLGLPAGRGPRAHEELRHLLQAATSVMPGKYKELAARLGYQVHIPDDAAPTWFVHLTLIYFKRLYLNRPHPQLCPRRPACGDFISCHCPAP